MNDVNDFIDKFERVVSRYTAYCTNKYMQKRWILVLNLCLESTLLDTVCRKY